MKLRLTYHAVIMTGILLFLYIPIVQNLTRLKWIKPLSGAYTEAPDPEFSFKEWFKGTFQPAKDAFINQNFGLRNYYVRLNNQIDFKLFKKANVDQVVVGKGNFLFEENYIESYFGLNFAGEAKLTERFKKLKDLQDLLMEQGIFLEVVFAPGKASFYPEYIPDSWRTIKRKNNYEASRDICKKLNVRFVDFNDWFLRLKNITPYDLYPKTGIHWSNYGSLIAFDSLTKHIEHYNRMNLKTFTIANVAFSDSLISPDEDIGKAMNLFRNIPVFPMPYAKYYWTDDTTFRRPKALFIGDSYFWNMYYEGLINNVFDEAKFWYYNQTVYPESEPEREVKKLNLIDEIKKQKVIVLLATECNIHDLGWGFIEEATELFKNEMKQIFRKNIYLQSITEEVYATPAWMADIEKKAKANHVSFEEQIKMDVEYVYKTDYGRPEVIKLTEETKVRIGNTPEWVEQIKKKAAEKNISVEEMMELDAKYIYVTEQRDKMPK